MKTSFPNKQKIDRHQKARRKLQETDDLELNTKKQENNENIRENLTERVTKITIHSKPYSTNDKSKQQKKK